MTGSNIIPEQWKYPTLQSLPVRKILVLKLRAIGDVLLSTSVLRNLREAFPDARIDFLTEHPARDIIDSNPDIDNALVFHTKNDRIVPWLWRLYKADYDLVFDLFCNPRSAQLCWATRANVRVGYPFRGRKYAYSAYVESRSNEIHNVDFNLDPLRALDIPIIDTEPHVPVDERDAEWATDITKRLRSQHPLLVAMNPSGTWETKRWGLEKFAALADALIEKHNALPILLWGPGEKDDVESIQAQMTNKPYIPPVTSLKQLAALLQQCDFTISNDAGPMHISAAVGTPTLGIFGPTNPYLQGPYHTRSSWVRLDDLDCIACNLTTCDIGNVCMTDLQVSAVLQAFENMMKESTK